MEEVVEERKHCVYMITSPSGKSYIGQTCNYTKRMWAHRNINSKCAVIRDAIQKYGWKNMIIKILLKNLTLTEVNKYEEFYISEHKTLVPNGYNLQLGGSNNALALKGKPKSEEHKEKTRQAHIGMKVSDEAKLNMSLSHLGFKPKQESIEKQVLTCRNNRNSIEYPYYELNVVGLPSDTIFNTKELASLLNVSQPCTITRRIRNGNFPNTVTSSKKGGKVYYIPIQDVHNYYTKQSPE